MSRSFRFIHSFGIEFIILKTELLENRLIVWNTDDSKKLFSEGYYGKPIGIPKPKLNEINERVQSSSVAELLLIKANLEQEQSELNKDLGGTQSPSENKRINERLAEISAEIQLVEAALIALGVAVVAGLSDDDSRATTPVAPTPDTTGPVITINGANPANAELGCAPPPASF